MPKASWLRFLPAFISTRIVGRVVIQRAVGNTLWLGIDRLFRLGVALVVSSWVARYLGPENFGLFSYALALVTLLGIFASLGLEGLLVRDFVRDPNSSSTLLGTALILRIGGGVVVFVLSLSMVYILRPDDMQLSILVAIIAIGSIFQAFDVIDAWFQSQLLSKCTVIAKNIAFLLVSVAKIVLILAKAPLAAFAWAATAELALGAGALVVAYLNAGASLIAWRVNLETAQRLLKEAWPLLLSGLSIAIYMRIDQVMLGEMLGNHAVGIYSAASRLSEITLILPTIIVASVSPALYALHKIDENLFKKKLQVLFNYLVAMSFFIALVINMLSSLIVGLLFGPEFIESSSVLSVHIWTLIFVSLGVAQVPWFYANGYTKNSAINSFAGGVVNVFLNYLFIPNYGPVGAAFATLFSHIVAATFMNCLSRRTRYLMYMHIESFKIWKTLYYFVKNNKREVV